ncbi:MAG: hypothetical protein J7L96_02270 [Bacteroidales bacterium]|nr:hypothetical protein [Bacteroidales bacterium]
MKVIIPRITDLQATNITENLGDWSTVTTYDPGEKKYVLISDFDDLITNGDCFFDYFSKDGAEWAYNSIDTQYNCDGTQTISTKLYQSTQATKIVAGDQYLIQFEVSAYTSGNIAGYCAGIAGSNVSALGYYQQLITAGSTDLKIGVIADAAFIGSVTNILIKKTGTNVQRDIYESQQSQSGNFPPIDDYTNWIRISASNRWKMFDDYVSTQTKNTETIQTKVDSSRCDAIALFDVEGKDTRIIVVENSINFYGTSNTSLTLGIGSKSLTASTTKQWEVGDLAEIESTADNNDWMVGEVTAYDSGTGALIVTINTFQGAGTFASWNVRYVYQNEPCTLYLSESTSWTTYFFAEVRFSASFSKTFPLSLNSSCRIVITGNDDQIVRCGHALVGGSRYLGKTLYGISAGIISYRIQETNTYGDTYLAPGKSAKELNFDFRVSNESKDQVYQILTQLDGIPCAWNANNDGEISMIAAYGVFDDFTEIMNNLNDTLISLEIQGLT